MYRDTVAEGNVKRDNYGQLRYGDHEYNWSVHDSSRDYLAFARSSCSWAAWPEVN